MKRLLAKPQSLHYSALQRPTMNTRDPKYYLFFRREQEDPLGDRKFCLPKQVRVSSEALSFRLAGSSFFPCKICCLKLFRDLTWLVRVCSVSCFGTAWRLLRNALPHGRAHSCRGFCLLGAELFLYLASFCLGRWQPGTLLLPRFRRYLGELFGSHRPAHAGSEEAAARPSPTPTFRTLGTSPRGAKSKNHGHVLLQTDTIQQLHKSPGRWVL